MVGRRTKADVFEITNAIVLTILVLVTIYPVLYVLFASLSDEIALYQGSKILLMPRGFSLRAYRLILNYPMVWVGYRNTLLYVTLGTTVNVVFCILTAYPLSRIYLPGRNAIMKAIVFTMIFSGGLIPLFLVVRSLGMINTMFAMVLPTAISAWNVIIMRTFFMGIPASVEESAKIDGANDYTILGRIILPVSIPVIAVIVLFSAVRHWNAYFQALVFLRSRTLYPLQLVLREILILNNTETFQDVAEDTEGVTQTVKYATIVVATAPILVMYPFLQRYFVAGIMIGSIKG